MDKLSRSRAVWCNSVSTNQQERTKNIGNFQVFCVCPVSNTWCYTALTNSVSIFLYNFIMCCSFWALYNETLLYPLFSCLSLSWSLTRALHEVYMLCVHVVVFSYAYYVLIWICHISLTCFPVLEKFILFLECSCGIWHLFIVRDWTFWRLIHLQVNITKCVPIMKRHISSSQGGKTPTPYYMVSLEFMLKAHIIVVNVKITERSETLSGF